MLLDFPLAVPPAMLAEATRLHAASRPADPAGAPAH
jgi:hypothetical protein